MRFRIWLERQPPARLAGAAIFFMLTVMVALAIDDARKHQNLPGIWLGGMCIGGRCSPDGAR